MNFHYIIDINTIKKNKSRKIKMMTTMLTIEYIINLEGVMHFPSSWVNNIQQLYLQGDCLNCCPIWPEWGPVLDKSSSVKCTVCHWFLFSRPFANLFRNHTQSNMTINKKDENIKVHSLLMIHSKDQIISELMAQFLIEPVWRCFIYEFRNCDAEKNQYDEQDKKIVKESFYRRYQEIWIRPIYRRIGAKIYFCSYFPTASIWWLHGIEWGLISNTNSILHAKRCQ